MAQAPALGEVVSNTSAKERQHKCEVLISEAMGIASVQNPFTDRNMPYEQPFQPDAGDAEAVPIFVILPGHVPESEWRDFHQESA